MNGKIVIAGGTGFVGTFLKYCFASAGYQTLIVSRQGEDIQWGDEPKLINGLEGATMLINLAGSPVNKRFTESNKKQMLSSRIETTQELEKAVLQCKRKPKLWINASGAHIYGTGDTIVHTEQSPIDLEGFFLAQMAKAWEDTFFSFHDENVRQVALRISMVLGNEGGVIQQLSPLAKWGLGGKQGTGKQKVSWIHLEDLFSIITFLFEHPEISGPVNTTSPQIIDNSRFMAAIRKAIGAPFGIGNPEILIQLGASLMGMEADLVLKSLSAYPEKLLQAGYQFKYPDIDTALKDIYRKT